MPYARPKYHILTGVLLVPISGLHQELLRELQADRDPWRRLSLDPEDQVEQAR